MTIYPAIQALFQYNKKLLFGSLVKYLSVVVSVCIFNSATGQTIRSAVGPNAGAIQPSVDQFRQDLGTLNPNVSGSFGSGRREINWDGVPDARSAPNNLPPDFFNVNSPRGVVFSTPGSGFQVSATASSGTPVEFGNINPTYPSLFTPFSPQRLFISLGSNITDVNFFVPGATAPALVRGFGVVFSDVDLSNVSSIQLFGAANNSLGIFPVTGIPGNETFAFLGISFPTPVISRVRIVSGNAILGSAGNENLPIADLVVMDDFIYGEPIPAAVPCILTCPANITVPNTTGQCGAVVNYPTPTNSGNCGTITASPASGSFFPVGITTVNVTSSSGATCSFTIRVNDVQAPIISSCPTVAPLCQTAGGVYTIPVLTATDNCPGVIVSYAVTGATTRIGSGNNASGSFNPGLSTITWRAQDVSGNFVTCTTSVNIGVNPTVTIPDAFSLSSGAASNTVYLGYAPASSITLRAQSSGSAPLTYTWSNGSHASSITVSPTVTTTYSVTVQSGNCTGTALKTINVVDVRCGKKSDKVQLCKVPPGNASNAHEICVSANAVAAHLAKGSYLGACSSSATTKMTPKDLETLSEEAMTDRLRVKVISNPAAVHFTVVLKSNLTQPLQVKIYNALGRLIEVRNKVAVGSTLQLGHNYSPGLYFAEVAQGAQRVKVTLLKGRQ